MKKVLAIALLAAAGFVMAGSAFPKTPRARVLSIASSAPPVTVMMVCNVNGLNYPVDYAENIWGRLPSTNEWAVVGQLVLTTRGLMAYRGGTYYPATC
jgi:hypothetical protein